MTGRALAVFALASVASALVACNALTGASDLQFDESPGAAAQDGAAPDVRVAPGPSDATADGADARPLEAGTLDAGCAVPTSTVESVTGTPTFAANGTQVGTIPWTVSGSDGRATLTAAQVTNYLVTTKYGLAATVPETAAITGFQVTVVRNGDFAGEIADNGVALVRAGVPDAP